MIGETGGRFQLLLFLKFLEACKEEDFSNEKKNEKYS